MNTHQFFSGLTAIPLKQKRQHPLHVPKLQMRKRWYQGLLDDTNPDFSIQMAKPKPNSKHNTSSLSLWEALAFDNLTQAARDSFHIFMPTQQPHHRLHRTDNVADDERWADEYPEDDDFLWVDAHVLGNPLVRDLNGDGHLNLIVPVSYYFDHGHRDDLDDDVDYRYYVAGAVAVFDLETYELVWLEQLDQSTTFTQRQAYIHSSPTICDLDNDGALDIIIGTSLGMVYALNGVNGKVLDGFPRVFAAIEAPIALLPLTVSSEEPIKMHLIVCDARGHVVCLNEKGETLWDMSIRGYSSNVCWSIKREDLLK